MSDTAAPPPLPQIDGLDTTRGLHFFAGRHALYLRSLRHFVALYAGGVTSIDGFLTDAPGASLEGARHDVHSVGGVAASLGAARLEQLARQFETLQRQADPGDDARPLLAAFRDELARLVQALQEQLPAA